MLPRCLWYSKHYKPLSHIALGYFMAKKGKEKKKKGRKEGRKGGTEEIKKDMGENKRLHEKKRIEES